MLCPSIDRTPSVPQVPKHIFRAATDVKLPAAMNLNISFVQTTEFLTQTNYRFNDERYGNAIGDNLETSPSTRVSPNGSRTILNFRLDKKLVNDKLSIYAFGNDVTNTGRIFSSSLAQATGVTISQVGGMFGLGANFRF